MLHHADGYTHVYISNIWYIEGSHLCYDRQAPHIAFTTNCYCLLLGGVALLHTTLVALLLPLLLLCPHSCCNWRWRWCHCEFVNVPANLCCLIFCATATLQLIAAFTRLLAALVLRCPCATCTLVPPEYLISSKYAKAQLRTTWKVPEYL